MSFKSLGVAKSLLDILAVEDYTSPYPIQEKAIPAILKKKDVLGIAQTGSGKTASYVLPILMNLDKEDGFKNRHIRVLVLVPTRELAIQVNETFRLFGKALPQNSKCMAVYGGTSINPQMKALIGVNILIATPGRLLDLLDSNALQLSDVRTLVLDEADKMLNLGFREEMNKLLALLPKKRQNLLFSATLSDQIAQIQQIVLNQPVTIKVEAQTNNLELINQRAFTLPEGKKGPFLRYLIKQKELKQVLVFASSAQKADRIVLKLHKNGIDAKAVHGKKSQHARTKNLDNFKSGELRVLVATDLLGRGIDIDNLLLVVNYELPRSPKDYIHRIGRTGRAESKGEAISLISPEEEHHFKIIQKKMGKQIELEGIEEINLHGF